MASDAHSDPLREGHAVTTATATATAPPRPGADLDGLKAPSVAATADSESGTEPVRPGPGPVDHVDAAPGGGGSDSLTVAPSGDDVDTGAHGGEDAGAASEAAAATAAAAAAAAAARARGEKWASVTEILQDCLQRRVVRTSTGGSADGYLRLPALPGLVVDGVGPVSLPITDAIAANLQRVMKQAPFGRDGDTVVDTSFRNTWQLGPESFTFRNPQWERGMPQIVQDVCDALDINTDWYSPAGSTVTHKPYKLLLYSKGGLFKPHRDTEKADGMFGTLIIQLPSEHTGGALVVRHRGVEVRHQFGVDTGAAAYRNVPG